jgi:D-lactate dehydrogenase (cytochrome)
MMPLDAATLDTLGGELRALVGDRLSTAQAVRKHHSAGETWHPAHIPDIVVFARSTDEVAAIVKVCARHKAPIIAFGTGTSLEGHISALRGGVSVDLSQMNRIVEVNTEDLDCTVEAGVTRKQLNEYLRDTGLFFPIDPGADASLGGMASTRASGTNAVRYGTMRENVLALTVVLADGRVIRTARRARKSAAGYDLTRLFVGSEGTLGIITEVTLRLYGIPEAMSSAVCTFKTLAGAVNTVIQTIQAQVGVARIELLDEVQVDAVNKYSKLDLPLSPMLLLEFHGSPASVKEQAEFVESIAAEHGGEGFKWTTKPEERSKLWQARHDVGYACVAYRPGAKMYVTDVCVPISRLADCILESKREIEASFLKAPIVGHVGDGNFHCAILVDPDSKKEIDEAKRLGDRIVARALANGGTCTGEHGIGYGKMDALVDELGDDALDIMRAIKRAIDPDDIMNPGKIVRL